MTALMLVLLASACGDDRAPPPPPPPPTDGSATDGGPSPDGTTPPGRSDAGPRLPPSDVEVILPYLGPEQTHAIVVRAELGQLDVHFSVDTTGSFDEEIDEMQASLRGTIIPQLRERVPDVAFGVSRFEDFPVAPFGGASDHPFTLLTGVTTDMARIGSAVAALDSPIGDGGDIEEAGAEALFQIATGEGYRESGRSWIAAYDGRRAPGGGREGGVGFRQRSLRVVVHITDAPTHEPGDYEPVFEGTRSLDEAIAALTEAEAHVIGIASGNPARPHLEQLAIGTGATTVPTDGSCPTGVGGSDNPTVAGTCPLVFDVERDGSGLSSAIVDSIAELVAGVRWAEVWGEVDDDPFRFVRSVVADRASAPTGIVEPGFADLRPVDGIDDTFTAVGPGTELVFELRLRNETLPPASYDQTFRVRVSILGDGVTLAEQTVRVTVPRGIPPRPDAGPAPDGGDAG